MVNSTNVVRNTGTNVTHVRVRKVERVHAPERLVTEKLVLRIFDNVPQTTANYSLYVS